MTSDHEPDLQPGFERAAFLRGALCSPFRRLAGDLRVVRRCPVAVLDFEDRVDLAFGFFDEARRLTPEPPFLPPPSCLLTVAQAISSARASDTP